MTGISKLQAPAGPVSSDLFNRLQALMTSTLARFLEKRADGKVLASGGLGIGKVTKTAGAAPGQLTVGAVASYEPRYDTDGRTVLGWVPIYSATVNP